MINIVNVGYDSTNYYVLAHTRPMLLIDVGFPQTLPQLQHTTRRAGIDLARIPYFICTHYHPDHAGAAEELRRLGVQLIIFEPQLEAIAQLGKLMKPEQHFQAISRDKAMTLGIDQSRTFLNSIGFAGQIVHTPGHSDDSITLVLDQGTAFTGDLTPPFMVSDDPDEPVRRSWGAIYAAGGRTLYPGHGPTGSALILP